MTPDLERLLGAMAACDHDETRVLSLYEDYLRSCGLDHFTLGFVAQPTPGREDLPGCVHIWTSLPDDWMEEYEAEGYAAHDFVVAEVQRRGQAQPAFSFGWGRDVADRPEVRPETGVVLRGVAEAGMSNAISFASNGGRGHDYQHFAATMGCARADGEDVAARVAAQRNELLVASFAMAPLLRPALERWRHGLGEVSLTPRERDVLGRFSEGLRPDQIAHKLGLTRRTVDMHSGNIRRKLQARTLAEATAKALRCGLLD